MHASITLDDLERPAPAPVVEEALTVPTKGAGFKSSFKRIGMAADASEVSARIQTAGENLDEETMDVDLDGEAMDEDVDGEEMEEWNQGKEFEDLDGEEMAAAASEEMP